jgi:hypothetical protein
MKMNGARDDDLKVKFNFNSFAIVPHMRVLAVAVISALYRSDNLISQRNCDMGDDTGKINAKYFSKIPQILININFQ